MPDGDVADVETALEDALANPFAGPPATPPVTAPASPPQASWWEVFEKHPLIATCVAILVFPVVLAAATFAGARWLFARGHRNLAIVVIVVGSLAALGAAYWYTSASEGGSPSRPDRTSPDEPVLRTAPGQPAKADSGCLEDDPTFFDYSAIDPESAEADDFRARGWSVVPGAAGSSCIYTDG